jgi:hypothetical protein
MSTFMDKAKDALEQAKEKASELAHQHSEQIERGIEKAGDFVDQKTHGKYAEKIDKAQSAAHGVAGKLAAQDTTDAEVADAPVPDPAAPVAPVGHDDPANPTPSV